MSKESSNFSPEVSTFSGFIYHHARPLEFCTPGIVTQKKLTTDHIDQLFDDSYNWLESQVGFYPLFLAVGNTEYDVRMTGYQNQWNKRSKEKNQVLFSYKEILVGVFVDYMNWHIVLNSGHRNYQIPDRERRMVLKPSWSKADWLRYAKRNPHTVQLVVPDLDLARADSVFCRNENTRQHLTNLGYQNVSVKRLMVE